MVGVVGILHCSVWPVQTINFPGTGGGGGGRGGWGISGNLKGSEIGSMHQG